ncbi:OsmC family protein [Parageobacillus thermoglucosidasius]|uniref:OsmC family protein n=1 Tax=Parageobacillus thermoglucosidasius TaxID=1426 RepID=A0AB38R591_PARTM|nr:OsmC family protein [Parageobacillus thermoglucosidasius]UOE77949.1 OsmC family protein [Parageobacillus thermoglucosidasius]
MKATVTWNGQMSFTGMSASGVQIPIDASKEAGGQDSGARPMELLLHGLAGCTGIDVIAILTKMRLEVRSFYMEVEGTRASDPPKRFTDIHLHYVFEGDLPEDKVVRAIRLSKEKYCSVSHSLNAAITASYSINGVKGKEIL